MPSVGYILNHVYQRITQVVNAVLKSLSRYWWGRWLKGGDWRSYKNSLKEKCSKHAKWTAIPPAPREVSSFHVQKIP